LGGVFFWPRVFSLRSYQIVFKLGLYQPFLVSVARTSLGIVTSVFFSAMLGYVLAHKELVGRKTIMRFFIYTMYFNAGLIPTYLLIRDLGLMNTFWVYIWPGVINVYNVILLRVYFEGIPPSMEESAKMDGANEFIIFVRIMLPLAMPILAAISIFVGVAQWNSWMDAYLYNTNNEKNWPLQMVLMNILSETSSLRIRSAADARAAANVRVSSQSIQLAITTVTTVPIIIIYPFFQKYFISGVMIGAVKE